MVPSLWPGDLVTVEGRPTADLRLGEIVLVERHARVYLHRMVGLAASGNGLSVLTQGDALSVPDPAASDAEVLGILTAIERGGSLMRISRARSLWNRSLATTLGSSANLLNCTLRLRRQYAKCGSEELVLGPAV